MKHREFSLPARQYRLFSQPRRIVQEYRGADAQAREQQGSGRVAGQRPDRVGRPVDDQHIDFHRRVHLVSQRLRQAVDRIPGPGIAA
jgi:hypothetical protein